jgi:hypothetical protein
MIIGVLGLANSGKSTVSNILKEDYNFEHLSFADSLKEAISAIFGWPVEMLQGKTSESREWREKVDEWWSQRLQIKGLTPRWVLQQWGTEVGRMSFHNDIWVASLQKKILSRTNNVVIDDCRFDNEIKALRDVKGIIIKVERGPLPEWHDTALKLLNELEKCSANEDTDKMMAQLSNIHISEWGWANQKVDYTLDNNQDLAHLKLQIKNLLKNYNI